ncbi:hypothetical protein [uncultured Rikenella sp.]|uniref:hypothetical protein n=1 Tax=uncultured Rikenella sp. TaxID=368003 RepID=UPI00272991BB|nr:hypothetical protein [uncultured Rikenella sp.]
MGSRQREDAKHPSEVFFGSFCSQKEQFEAEQSSTRAKNAARPYEKGKSFQAFCALNKISSGAPTETPLSPARKKKLIFVRLKRNAIYGR